MARDFSFNSAMWYKSYTFFFGGGGGYHISYFYLCFIQEDGLIWDKHKNVTELNWLLVIGSELSHLDN